MATLLTKVNAANAIGRARMDTYVVWLLLLGFAWFGAAWLPHVIRGAPISLPIVYVLVGGIVFSLPIGLQPPDPERDNELTLRLSELLVIVSLTGVGLKLDRPLGIRSWGSTWRLLAIAMPICIVAFAVMGWWFLELVPATAILLGAALAPTDPVLAAEVQAGPPGDRDDHEVRFALTSEAGLNDGLAFPFTNFALAVAGAGASNWHLAWFTRDVLYKTAAGVAVGVAAGTLLSYLMFRVGGKSRLARTGEGIAAPALTLIPYATAELVSAYGFLAVFIAAVTFRNRERGHEYHRTLHDLSEDFERMLMAVALVLIGGAVVGGLLRPLTWPGALVGLAFLLIVRPLAGLIALTGTSLSLRDRAAISFFGIRGVGSVYYLAYAIHEENFRQTSHLWAIVGWVIVASIVVHGILAAPTMRRIERHHV